MVQKFTKHVGNIHTFKVLVANIYIKAGKALFHGKRNARILWWKKWSKSSERRLKGKYPQSLKLSLTFLP